MNTADLAYQPKKKILVVEDDTNIRDLYTGLLTDEGYEVDSAVNGEEGYNKIINKIYDLILLDLLLPKMTGIDLLMKLEEEYYDYKQKQKFVVLTNLDQDPIIGKAITLGARGYIIKTSLTPYKLLEEIKSYLD